MYLFVHKQNSFPRIYLFCYVMMIRIFPLHNKKNWYVTMLFVQNQAKPIREFREIHIRLIHLDGRNLIIFAQQANINIC